MDTQRPHHHHQGFTLVEVLVALTVMAIIAGLAWQGIAGMVRTRDSAVVVTERILRLQSVLAQWEADLQASIDTGVPVPLEFNGSRLILTRRVEDGVQVVVWALHGQKWQRWASPTIAKLSDVQDQWMRGIELIGNETTQLTTLDQVADWRLYYFINNAWANAQSSGDAAGGSEAAPGTTPPQSAGVPATHSLPLAVRLEIDFAQGNGLSGTLRRDIRL